MTRHVPISEFKDNASRLFAAVEGGEEIVVTRHGKPTVRMTAAAANEKQAQRAAIEALWALGKQIKDQSGPTPIEEILGWIGEDRR